MDKKIHHEWLNSRYGYFFTVRKKIHSCTTRFQKLDLVESDELGRTLILDGITQVAEKSEFQYHEPMVHPALCAHTRSAPRPGHRRRRRRHPPGGAQISRR